MGPFGCGVRCTAQLSPILEARTEGRPAAARGLYPGCWPQRLTLVGQNLADLAHRLSSSSRQVCLRLGARGLLQSH